jgi:hypothetical protein
LDDHERWWGGKRVGGGKDVCDRGFFEVALFPDEGADKRVVVFEEGICLG